MVLGGRGYARPITLEMDFADWNTDPSIRNTVSVCSAYGCQKTTKVTFERQDTRKIAWLMGKKYQKGRHTA